MSSRTVSCGDLRMKCFVIGYMNLVACVVDIAFHLIIAAIVSRGFQCDVDKESLSAAAWPWLEPLLLFVNLGTHGFYALPMTVKANGHCLDRIPLLPHPKCYPGMVHIYLIDILNLLINIIWLKFVLTYISALHKKDPEPMRMFFHLSLVKLILLIIYFAYDPAIQNTFPIETFWLMKLVDIGFAATFLFIINSYINVLRDEKAGSTDLPPYYVQCLMGMKKKQEDGVEKMEVLSSVAVVSDIKDEPAEIKHVIYQ